MVFRVDVAIFTLIQRFSLSQKSFLLWLQKIQLHLVKHIASTVRIVHVYVYLWCVSYIYNISSMVLSCELVQRPDFILAVTIPSVLYPKSFDQRLTTARPQEVSIVSS
jgi:hypothetical protein